MHMPEYYAELDAEDSAFMHGDRAAMLAEPAPVQTALLIGFDGRRLMLTGTRAALWREFMRGDGGPGCNGVRPCGWQYFIDQELGATEPVIPPTITVWEIN